MMIIFDFDGTLADSIGLGFEIANSHAAELGYNRVERERGMEMSALEIMKEAGISIWKLPHLIFLLKKKLEENKDRIQMLKGADELLSRLKNDGFDLGLITSHSADGVAHFLEKYNISSFFSYIKTDVPLFGKKKALKKALKSLKSRFVYVGDELRDVEACHKTGVPIVSVPWGFNSVRTLEKKNPGRVAKTVDEAYTFIRAEAETINS